jgi:uncharacterized protein (TIGR02271 family)
MTRAMSIAPSPRHLQPKPHRSNFMTTTLIGVFDDVSQARQAAETVRAAGIDRDRIDVRADSSELPAADEDRRGFFARLFGLGDDDDSSSHYGEAVRRGSAVVSVSLADDSRTDEICDLLEQCGAADVDERVEQWKTDGYAPMARPSGAVGAVGAGGEDQTLQSVEEELQVGKREVHKGRVRVHRTTTETPVEEAVTLREEKAQIDRRPVDRPATESEMQTAFEDQDIEIVETAEEPVVSKSARVVEEVTVGKKVSERTESVRDKVRSTRVDVDNDADTPGTPAGMRRYAGPERRTASGLRYAGVERRMGH